MIRLLAICFICFISSVSLCDTNGVPPQGVLNIMTKGILEVAVKAEIATGLSFSYLFLREFFICLPDILLLFILHAFTFYLCGYRNQWYCWLCYALKWCLIRSLDRTRNVIIYPGKIGFIDLNRNLTKVQINHSNTMSASLCLLCLLGQKNSVKIEVM